MANVYVETRWNDRDVFTVDGTRGRVRESAPEVIVTMSELTAEQSARCFAFFQELTQGGAIEAAEDAEPGPLVNKVRELIF